ncbi:unnamed protein product [Calicophoron daubneyi]|uniref:GP-PDE domain-containing protein n=1 Tax=Calicophoron daubneyi TaxID=300641 RepID=A0AAV2T577_CALDB
MREEGCQLSVSLFVEVDFQLLEDVGVFVAGDTCSSPDDVYIVGICGDIPALGNWNPERGVMCKLSESDNNGVGIWNCRFTCDLCRSFSYRYFIAEVRENNDEYSDSNLLRVLAWESRLVPRAFSVIDLIDHPNDKQITHSKFGVFDDGKFIQRGWLTSNSEIHVRLSGTACKFFNSAFLSSTHPLNQLYIACFKYVVQPTFDDEYDADVVTYEQTNNTRTSERLQGELTTSHRINGSRPPLSTGSLSFTPVGQAQPVLLSTLEINRCRAHRGENTECWGTLYKPGDDVTFYVETNDVENTAVVVEFYLQEQKPAPKDALHPIMKPLKFLGSARFGPFDGTYGPKASQILNSKQVPIGDLRIKFLIIHPMTKAPSPSLAVSYQHHWKKRRRLDIGHRGMGTSFLEPSEKQTKKASSFKENTLDSFRTAFQHGADYVEMDVQLTKDHKVIVYHDYEAVIVSKKKRGGELSYLPIAIKDLTYADLRELKVNHSSVLRESHSREQMDEEDLDPIELQSFPLLQACFDEVDPDLGFLIEVKYPMEFKAGGSEMGNFFEYNFYVDTILREILTHAGSRRILLSCFDPNVSVMLQLKQNIYPVFQLGIEPEYSDSRHADFERLCWSALSHQLLGVCLDSDRLLTVPKAVRLAHLHGLVVLAWGEAVNYAEKRAQLTELGVDGLIYDRLQESKEKGTISVFKQEHRDASPSSSQSEPTTFQLSDRLSPEGNGSPSMTVDPKPALPIGEQLGGKIGSLDAHTAVMKECVMAEKVSDNASSTTCTSIPPTGAAQVTQFTEIENKQAEGADANPATADSSSTVPVLQDVALLTKSSSAQPAIALITLA